MAHLPPGLARLSIEIQQQLGAVPSIGPTPPPREFRIFAKGLFRSLNTFGGRNEWVFDDQSAKLVMEKAARKGTDYVIDYEHQSVVTEGRAPAAGFFKLQVRNGELWATDIEWTEQGAADLKSGRDPNGNRTAPNYRYFSPVFSFDKAGVINGLTNLGLTNMPATRDMAAIAAKQQITRSSSSMMSSRAPRSIPSFAPPRARKEFHMAGSNKEMARQAHQDAIEALKSAHADVIATLRESRDNSVNDAKETQAALSEAKSTITAKDAALAAKDAEIAMLKATATDIAGVVGKATLAEAKGVIAALKQEAEKAVADMAALKVKQEKTEADAKVAKLTQLVEQGIADGKITPAEKDAFLKADLSFVETIISVRPKIVNTTSTPQNAPAVPPAQLDGLDPEMVATLKAMGQDPAKVAADLKKSGVPIVLQ
jgi:phage I-like protein